MEALWPIVVRAVEMGDGWRDIHEIRAAARRAAIMETLVREFARDFPLQDRSHAAPAAG